MGVSGRSSKFAIKAFTTLGSISSSRPPSTKSQTGNLRSASSWRTAPANSGGNGGPACGKILGRQTFGAAFLGRLGAIAGFAAVETGRAVILPAVAPALSAISIPGVVKTGAVCEAWSRSARTCNSSEFTGPSVAAAARNQVIRSCGTVPSRKLASPAGSGQPLDTRYATGSGRQGSEADPSRCLGSPPGELHAEAAETRRQRRTRGPKALLGHPRVLRSHLR